MDSETINKIKIELDNSIKNDIKQIYTKTDFHNYLQKKIATMSKIFGLKSIMEYKLINCNGYNRRIDVVWINSNKKLLFAIEIDSCLRIKSLEKLNHIDAENKIWILYCNKIDKIKFSNLMSEYNVNKEIHIIYLDLKH